MYDSSKNRKIESSIPNWVVYALIGAVTFLIANTIHAAALTLLVSGVMMLFVWSYMSKPVAEIQPRKEETIFDKNKINRSTFSKVTESNPQRRRYLRSIDDIDNAA
tara:strand:- start:363 stop:680 length:318 start_codon:yes stop_codon:yes gene_type:complete